MANIVTTCKDFMSVENFKNMISIFKRFLLDKHGIDIDSTTIDLKRTLLDTMERVHADLGSGSTSTREMNQITLKSIKNTVLKAIAVNQSNTNGSNLLRDSTLYGNKRAVNSSHILPEATTIKAESGVAESFERIRQQREPVSPASVPQVLEPFMDVKPMHDDEFKQRLKSMQDARQSLVLSHAQDARQSLEQPDARQSLEQPDARQSIMLSHALDARKSLDQPDAHQSIMLSHALDARKSLDQPDARKSLDQPDARQNAMSPTPVSMSMLQMPKSHDRNALMSDTRERNSAADPKALYMPLEHHVVDVNRASLDFVNNRSFVDNAVQNEKGLGMLTSPEKPVPYVIKERYILANSIDRDWLQQLYRYNYKLRFTRTTQTTMSIPIYTNNPTVPHTGSLTTPGLPNVAGYYDSSGNSHAPYDNTQGYGAQIGTETVTLPVDTNANVQSTFKNIHSIQVTNVIIPMDVLVPATPFGNFSSSTVIAGGATSKNVFNYDFNFKFPYVLLQIDELRDLYDGTDDPIRNSFCQLVFYKSYQSNSGRGYVVLRPAQDEKKIFYPSALSTLPTLTVSLLRPNGQLINTSMDGLTIKKIDHMTDQNTLYLQVWTNNFFDKNEFCQGDTVLIKAYALFMVSETQNSSDIDRFNEFINQPRGHEVIALGQANTNGFYNSFYIPAPGSFDAVAGAMSPDTGVVNQLDLFNTGIAASTYFGQYLADITSGAIKNGYVLNMSLQNSISFKIEQKVYDSTVIGSVNV